MTAFRLRILTGKSAGTCVDLKPGLHRLGSSDKADIQLEDWSGHDDRLLVTESATFISVAPVDGASDPGIVRADKRTLEPFEPQIRGTVVWCVGPMNAHAREEWPSDISILKALADAEDKRDADARGAASPTHRPLATMAVVICLALGGAGFAVMASTAERPASPLGAEAAQNGLTPPTGPALDRLVRELLEAHQVWSGSVQRTAEGMVVSGWVAGADERIQLEDALSALAPHAIKVQIMEASAFARQLEDSVSEANLRVAYRGDGRFAATGNASQPERVVERLRHIIEELAQHRLTLEVHVNADLKVHRSEARAQLATGALQYTQDRSGTKHIRVAEPQELSPGGDGATR